MLRLLIRDITVEKLLDQRQLVLHVRWQGGACNDITVNLPRPVAEAIRCPAAIVEQVRGLSQRLSDLQIVAHLNQEGLRSPHGKPFTLAMIKWIRYKYAIPPTCLMRRDELTVQQLAKRLRVSTHVVYYWIERRIVEARKLDSRGGVVDYAGHQQGTRTARLGVYFRAPEAATFQHSTVRGAL